MPAFKKTTSPFSPPRVKYKPGSSFNTPMLNPPAAAPRADNVKTAPLGSVERVVTVTTSTLAKLNGARMVAAAVIVAASVDGSSSSTNTVIWIVASAVALT